MRARAGVAVLGGMALVAALAVFSQQPDDALVARVADLEQKLQDQQRRQQQLEATVTKALDATAVHVDAILQQLAVLAPGGAPGATAEPAPMGPAPTGPTPATSAHPVEATAHELGAAAEQREAAFLRNRLQSHTGWLIAVLTVGVTAIGFLAWRLVRQSPRPPQATGGDANAARGDMTTDELWAAAGLLGEAVGRLRGGAPAQAAGAAPAPLAAPADDLDLTAAVRDDDVFVLDDDDDALLAAIDWEAVGVDDTAVQTASPSPDPTASAPPQRPVEGAAADATRAAPLPWTISLDTRDPVTARAAVDAYLRSDPRVLRMPAPVVRSSGDGITVELALLPGLLAGEREHLRSTLQRLLTRS